MLARATPGPFPVLGETDDIPTQSDWDGGGNAYLGLWAHSECGCRVEIEDDDLFNANIRLLATARNVLGPLVRVARALEHYADPGFYEPDTNCAEPIAQTFPPECDRDKGMHARVALDELAAALEESHEAAS